MSTQSNQSNDHLTLYQFESCPFCVRVRIALNQLDAEVELRDTIRDPASREELIRGGGRSTVPCLRIDHPDGSTEWMYESARIVEYLKDRYPPKGAAH